MKNATHIFTNLEPNSPDELCLLAGLKCRIVRRISNPASDCIVEIDATYTELATRTGLPVEEIEYCFDPIYYANIDNGYPMIECYERQLDTIGEAK